MFEWFENADLALKVLYCIAVPSTFVLIVQTVMMLMGFGEADTGIDGSDVSGLDMDVDIPDDISAAEFTDGGNPADFVSMRLITVQTVIAFLTVFSWSAIVTCLTGGDLWLALLIGAILGVIAMFLLAKLVQLSAKLAENGTQDLKYSLGDVATVYIPIPPANRGIGKVTITLQGRFSELEATQEGDELIPVSSKVRVIDIRDDILIVEKE